MLKSQNKRELEVQLCWNRLKKPNGGSRKGISPRKKNKKKKRALQQCLRLFQDQKERWLYGWGKEKMRSPSCPGSGKRQPSQAWATKAPNLRQIV